jgi:hypothetical protein
LERQSLEVIQGFGGVEDDIQEAGTCEWVIGVKIGGERRLPADGFMDS